MNQCQSKNPAISFFYIQWLSFDDSCCNLSPWCCYNWSFLSYFHLIVAVLILSVSFKFLILSCYQTRESLQGITSHAHHFPRTSLVVGYLATPPGMALVSCKKKWGRQTEGPLSSSRSLLPPPTRSYRSFSSSSSSSSSSPSVALSILWAS